MKERTKILWFANCLVLQIAVTGYGCWTQPPLRKGSARPRSGAIVGTRLFSDPQPDWFFDTTSQKQQDDALFGVDEECKGTDQCDVTHEDTYLVSAEDLRQSNFIDVWIPILVPIVAYASYEYVARGSDFIIHWLAGNNWVAVDGGAYEAKVITPAINGVVIPAITILFATLISNTFSTLRQRQQDIRARINMEAGELRVLQSMVEFFPDSPERERCRSYLIDYTSRLISESKPGVDVDSLVAIGAGSELNGFLNQLNEMSLRSDIAGTPSSSLLGEAYAAISRLNSDRGQRISALQSSFPRLHFAILTALACSICLAFLLETGQEIVIFLGAFQMRILWTMLMGTFSALGVVCYDLLDPFRGSYEISKSVDQLYTLRSALLSASASLAKVPK